MSGINVTISTKRLSTSNGKKTYATNLSNVEVYLEPASPEIVGQIGGVVGYKVYTLICEDVIDVELGDRVFDADSVEYSVYAVDHFENNVDVPSHTEAILRKEVE